jgi:hypothetical protein
MTDRSWLVDTKGRDQILSFLISTSLLIEWSLCWCRIEGGAGGGLEINRCLQTGNWKLENWKLVWLKARWVTKNFFAFLRFPLCVLDLPMALMILIGWLWSSWEQNNIFVHHNSRRSSVTPTRIEKIDEGSQIKILRRDNLVNSQSTSTYSSLVSGDKYMDLLTLTDRILLGVLRLRMWQDLADPMPLL